MDKQYAIYMSLGFELVAAVTVLILIGRYLDNNYGWGGWGVILGAFIATAGWIAHLLIIMRQLAKKEEAGDTDPK